MTCGLLQVAFHNNCFLSGSVDGMINVYDVSDGFDEDDGFLVSAVLDSHMNAPSSFAVLDQNKTLLLCMASVALPDYCQAHFVISAVFLLHLVTDALLSASKCTACIAGCPEHR